MNDDNDLVTRCKAGDLQAFEQLMVRYRGVVYKIARAIVGHHEEAEDITQQAFVKAYAAIRTFKSSYSFEAWLRRITVNCAISRLRKRDREPDRARPQPLTNADPPVDPQQHAADSEFQSRVNQAIAALPPRQRAAMTLFALEDMDLAGTASAMGCAAGTVKVHLHRARRKLYELLADYFEEGPTREL